MKRFRKPLGKRNGSAMLEFALGATVLVTSFIWCFQYGYTLYRYNALLAAINAGARYASLAAYDSNSTTPSGTYSTAVKNVVVYGNPAGSGSPVLPGLTTSNVNLAMSFAAGVPAYATVNISNFSIHAGMKTMTFTGKPTVKYKYQGIYKPGA